jgi:hypothetical protein
VLDHYSSEPRVLVGRKSELNAPHPVDKVPVRDCDAKLRNGMALGKVEQVAEIIGAIRPGKRS